MRKFLFASAVVTMVSSAALAQSANNGAGATGPGVSQTVTSPGAPRVPARQMRAPVNRRNGTVSSNGTRTTSTGGIDHGVGTTLSTTGGGGDLGNGAGGNGATGK